MLRALHEEIVAKVAKLFVDSERGSGVWVGNAITIDILFINSTE